MCTRATRIVAVALLSASLRALPAAALTTTIQPSSQDAFIMQNKPNRIAGAGPNNTRVRVQGSPPGTQVWRGLVQFDLSQIPTGAIVSSAILELYQGSVAHSPPPLSHGLYPITVAWLQSAVKWNDQPPASALPSVIGSVIGGQGPRDFDVTADVQSFVDVCATDHGWMIKSTTESGAGVNNDDVNYVSKEESHPADLAKRPKLTVTYTAPPCTVDADCADASACTVNERCVAGSCIVDVRSCDDGNPCTDDICDCTVGCINAPICNDGFTCTTDTCNPSTLECTHTFNDGACDGECSTGTCVADPDSTTIDPVTGCMLTSTSADGTPCTPDASSCTDDECLAGACSHPVKSDGSSCDDGNACTTGDQCSGGQCSGSGPVCTALDQCHDAGVCDAQSGLCSNPPKASGAGCDDGDGCTQTDQCDGAGACVGANPVVCTALDQCHVAGTCDPGPGTCSNPPAADGTSCDDGNECTLTDACTNGACVSGSSITCGDGMVQTGCGEECDGDVDCDAECHFICGPVPQTGCHVPTASGKAKLLVKDKTPDKADRLTWKWVKGDATFKPEFGAPLGSTDYTLCIYDQSAASQPIVRASIPAAGTCAGKPCWKETAKGFKYKDKELDPDGIQLALLKSGPSGKAKIIVKGKGANVPLPALPLTPTVTVQLKNADACWQAEYGTATKNDAEQFKAKAD